MTRSVRITLVATGFDQTKQRLQQFVIQQPTPQIKTSPMINNEESTQSMQQQQQEQGQKDDNKKPEDDWDIPAFLRQRN
jgi:hypothetical protein